MRLTAAIWLLAAATAAAAEEFPKPYSPPCVERENVFEFTEKPKVKNLGNDKYEITFAVRGNCDVTVGIVDGEGKVVRHLGSGVLGANAPAPFQKNSLKQTLYWNGKDDLDEYHKTPEKLRVRVMLGLKPEFDRRLGGVSPYNIPGRIVGLAVDEEAAYVWSMGPRAKSYVRRFARDGRYLGSLVPPPANLPEAKLSGMGYVEYEPGRRAVHSPGVYESVAVHGDYMSFKDAYHMADCRPVITGGKIFYLNCGEKIGSLLFFTHTDGSTEVAGARGRPFAGASHAAPRLAASPDGSRLYMVGIGGDKGVNVPMVLTAATDGTNRPTVFAGAQSPGSDETHFNGPRDIACDGKGRVYVGDLLNNRIQVFSPEGHFLHTLAVDRPEYVCVQPKTGALYVQHGARVEGQTRVRVTKFESIENPRPVAQVDGPYGMMALDHWSNPPRLWFANGTSVVGTSGATGTGRHVVEVWEEQGNTFRKILDFDQKAREEDGPAFVGRWPGSALGQKVVCDPAREQVYVSGTVYDLKTGKPVKQIKLPPSTDDIAFDKRGYVHCHFNPGFYIPGVGRLDPSRDSSGFSSYPEVPYDYGVEAMGPWNQKWSGILPVKDQPGAKFFQDGIGVNMRGDVAEVCYVYYVPKMDDVAKEAYAWDGKTRLPFQGWLDSKPTYEGYKRRIADLEKDGVQTYFIRRAPGVPLAGATLWTFERTGELRTECAAIGGNLINGVQIDEDGSLYFTANRPRVCNPANPTGFLAGKGGTFGAPEDNAGRFPFTGTFMKTKGANVRILINHAPIPLEPLPAGPPDVFNTTSPGFYDRDHWAWVEGAEWLYAGSSPIVSVQPCSCPAQRSHVDWYKRSYVLEAYRHSIGILDTGGNLIMHMGTYGNFDSGNGLKSMIPVGSDGITMCLVRFVSGTDNYLSFEDNGERLVALKLNYHAEESVGISNQ